MREIFALGVEAAHGYRHFHDIVYNPLKSSSIGGGSTQPRTTHSDPTEQTVAFAQREAEEKGRRNLLGAVRQLNEIKRELESIRTRFKEDKQAEWTKNAAYFSRADYEKSVAALARRKEIGEL